MAPTTSAATTTASADPNAQQHRPHGSLFRQQRLPAWQPVMSPPYVVGCLLLVAVAFLPIGISIIVANGTTVVTDIPYENQCTPSAGSNYAVKSTWLDPVTRTTQAYEQGCTWSKTFQLTQTMPAPIYMYYKLTNFYQNHRRFVRSRSEVQLAGGERTKAQLSDCDPILTPVNSPGVTQLNISTTPAVVPAYSSVNYNDMYYSPCGLVPWSMFNDSFVLSEVTTNRLICDTRQFDKTLSARPFAGANMSCVKSGITWDTDLEKFAPPIFSEQSWTGDRRLYTQDNNGSGPLLVNSSDPFLQNGWYANEAGHSVPINTDLDLIVWSRTASMPSFIKLLRIINTSLPAGNYTLLVHDTFNVSSFGGTKTLSLQTTSWVGGRNDFLGYAYVVVGSVSIVLALVLFVLHRVWNNRPAEAIQELQRNDE